MIDIKSRMYRRIVQSAPRRLVGTIHNTAAVSCRTTRRFTTTTTARATVGAGPTPVVATVLDTALLAVSGRDATKVLQDLITNDIHKLATTPTPAAGASEALYSCFLNSKGRYLTDCMITAFPPQTAAVAGSTTAPSYLISVDGGERIMTPLIRHLQMYQLRNQLTLTPLTRQQFTTAALFAPAVSAVPGTTVSTAAASSIGRQLLEFASSDASGHTRAFTDPRTRAMQHRIILPTERLSDALKSVGVARVSDSIEYDLHRIVNGVPNGAVDLSWGSSLPLESSMDWLNAVSYTKGCYLGQELTTRTHFTGQIRKRLIPCVLVPRPRHTSEARAAKDDAAMTTFNRIAAKKRVRAYDSGELFLPQPGFAEPQNGGLTECLTEATAASGVDAAAEIDFNAPIVVDSIDNPPPAATAAATATATGSATGGRTRASATEAGKFLSGARRVGMAMLRVADTSRIVLGADAANNTSYLRCGEWMLLPFAPPYFVHDSNDKP